MESRAAPYDAPAGAEVREYLTRIAASVAANQQQRPGELTAAAIVEGMTPLFERLELALKEVPKLRKKTVSSPSGQGVHSVDRVSTEAKPPEKYREIAAPDVVAYEGKEYNRTDHPMFFIVIDWLNANRNRADSGVRKIAAETDVSKSYVAVARRWWREQQGD